MTPSLTFKCKGLVFGKWHVISHVDSGYDVVIFGLWAPSNEYSVGQNITYFQTSGSKGALEIQAMRENIALTSIVIYVATWDKLWPGLTNVTSLHVAMIIIKVIINKVLAILNVTLNSFPGTQLL